MELTLKGDYYEWYCDWCDTRNLTLTCRVADEKFVCCACHRTEQFRLAPPPASSWRAPDRRGAPLIQW